MLIAICGIIVMIGLIKMEDLLVMTSKAAAYYYAGCDDSTMAAARMTRSATMMRTTAPF